MRRIGLICSLLLLGVLAACGGNTMTPPATPAMPGAAAAPVYTASFVCEDGNTPVQNAVCGNQQLAGLDMQMAAVFRQHMGSDGIFERDQVLAAQSAWLVGLPTACNVTSSADASGVSCLVAAYQAQITALTNWPVPQGNEGGGNGMAAYVHYKLLDAKQPELCAALGAQVQGALDENGVVDPGQLQGGQEIAGSHGNLSSGNVSVDLYRAGLYGGYQMRARGVSVAGKPSVITPTSLGEYVMSLPNNGGRFVSFASQTSDYGAIDVFTFAGQTLALVSDTVGYNSPAPPGEAAVAGVYGLAQNTAAPACLFETYLVPPPVEDSVFSQQASLTPFLALVDAVHGAPSDNLASSDREVSGYFYAQTRWLMFNMPRVMLAQEKAGYWTGWLRARHDMVLDALYAWSQKSPDNQAAFAKLFGLLQPAAADLQMIYVQQQGLSAADAEQATAIAMMELVYQATENFSPGLGGAAVDAAKYDDYKPRYPILAGPQ